MTKKIDKNKLTINQYMKNKKQCIDNIYAITQGMINIQKNIGYTIYIEYMKYQINNQSW